MARAWSPLAATVAMAGLAAALAGCIAPTHFEHCGVTYTSLAWKQPGLADAISNATSGAHWDAGGGRLPWTSPWTNATGLRLATIQLKVADPVEHQLGAVAYNDPAVLWIQLEGTGTASTSTEGNVSDDEVVRAFHRLAENASAAPPEAIAQAALAFARARTDTGTRTGIPRDAGEGWREEPVWAYQATMPGPLRLEALLDGLGVPFPQLALATGHAATAPWSFEFTLPTWKVTQGEDMLQVGLAGDATYTGPETASVEAMRSQAWDFANRTGLPHLAIEDATGSAFVC